MATQRDDADDKAVSNDDTDTHKSYMELALEVARHALALGEVPVGCVIVLDGHVVSHGANQVNATRDATRHAELVAIDRMLTGGVSSDQLRLPLHIYARSVHDGLVPENSPLLVGSDGNHSSSTEFYQDYWNSCYVPNASLTGWGSGMLYSIEIFRDCDLYVTCEPCIMCAAALRRVGIRRVVFGCRNDKFGGCGSILSLHDNGVIADEESADYAIVENIMAEEAVALLRRFYNRENFHAPDSKRKRKPATSAAV